MKKWMLVFGLIMAGSSLAKLPAPSEEAKAQADEAKAKTAWSDKAAAFKLCLAQDKVAANYLKAKGAGNTVPATQPCTDPGPYVSPMAAPAASASATVVTTNPPAVKK